MKRTMLAILFSLSTTACLDLDTSQEEAAMTAAKVEIDPTGKTKCDSGNNDSCFAAAENKDKCPDKDGKYSGTCWCTHCEGGNICETESDHTAHDEKCTLKAPES